MTLPARYLLLLFVFTTVSTLQLNAQSEQHPTFIGINPSITIEPFYSKGEMDINILPIVFQRPITSRADVRANPILNLGIRNTGNEISHFGVEAALPIFFKKKESKTEDSKGFFLAPVVSVTRNRMAAHNNIGLWAEPGYHLLFENRFAISFGLQVGATYFSYDDGLSEWGTHFGVKVILGKWL